MALIITPHMPKARDYDVLTRPMLYKFTQAELRGLLGVLDAFTDPEAEEAVKRRPFFD